MSQIVRLFTNGRSQAVRLPTAFRFDTREVYIRQDPETGDVILSRKPADWKEFRELLQSTVVPDDFLSPAERRENEVSGQPERDPLIGFLP
jgi:antitoxin VapB